MGLIWDFFFERYGFNMQSIFQANRMQILRILNLYERLHPKRITSYPKIEQFGMFSKTGIMTNA